MRELCVLVLCGVLSACAVPAPRYVAQPQNQSMLQTSGLRQAAVGNFSAKDPDLEHLTIRGNPLSSSTGTSSGDIRQALETELRQAGLLSTDPTVMITGTLLSNELDGRGISEGNASISVEFVVQRNGTEAWRAVKTASHIWESFFSGAKAVPAASQGYVDTIGKLVAELLQDPGFQAALK